MPRLGILGFANTGKTTVFNALTGLSAVTAPHPFATIEPNLGVGRIHDHRLEQAAAIERSAKLVPATLDLIDLPALGHDGKGGAAGQYLARLREMDALLMVLRAFNAADVPSQESGIDPVAQAEALSLELTVADFDVFDRRRQRLAKEATADPGLRGAAEAVAAAADHLSSGHPLRSRSWTDEALAAFQDSSPLTLKPAVWVVNVDEDQADPSLVQGRVEQVVPSGDMVVVLSARLEEEGSRLTSQDRIELFEGLGLGEGALAKVVAAAYRSLGLITFYTLGPKEAHAWTVKAGSTAPTAAGKIHSDLERGFIRAEVIGIDKVIEQGGWDPAKRNGAVRVEGRSYPVGDGDVLVVRFSV
jgi:hypothetical protein